MGTCLVSNSLAVLTLYSPAFFSQQVQISFRKFTNKKKTSMEQTFTPAARAKVEVTHPLMEKLAQKGDNELRQKLQLLRNTQGIGAALHLQMAAQHFSQPLRHPCMSQQAFPAARDVILGKDIEIDFEDFLSPEAYREVSTNKTE